MPKLDEINRLLKLTKATPRDGDTLAKEKLADLLDEQEEVLYATNGSLNGVLGVLITTDSRLLFADHPFGKKMKADLKVTSIPYEGIQVIECSRNFLGVGTISIIASGVKSKFGCDTKQVKVISELIHARSPSSSKLVAGKVPTTTKSIVSWKTPLIAVGIFLLLFSIMVIRTTFDQRAAADAAEQAAKNAESKAKAEAEAARGINKEIAAMAEIPSGNQSVNNLSSRKSVSKAPVDCYALSKFAEAKGHGWLERSAIVADAEKRGDCVWDNN